MEKKLNLSLPAHLRKWVDRHAIKKGFDTPNALVVDLLKREQAIETREKLEAYLTEAIKGPFTPMTSKDWEEIRVRGRKRVRERRKK